MLMQVKRKRIAELSVRTLPSQIHRKSHWGFVLEEMSWLANDFAQVIFLDLLVILCSIAILRT